MLGDASHDELLQRIERELIDGYDEELELEVEDRNAEHLIDDPAARDATERSARLAYFRELFRLQGEL
jgi:hypothetical protein